MVVAIALDLNEDDEKYEAFSSRDEESVSSQKAEEDYLVDDMDKEVMNMVFDIEEDAYEFYNLYGKLTSLALRR